MGNMDDIRGGKAEFREPSSPESVIMGGEVEHRRPGPPGASPEEEARHEVPSQLLQPSLSVCPENVGGTDQRPGDGEPLASPGLQVLPSQGHNQAQEHHPARGRSAGAGRSFGDRRRGTRRAPWAVTVVAISPRKYPEFDQDRDNPFAAMSAERRDEEIDSFCAHLWMRTCLEAAREGSTRKGGNRAAA